MSQTTDPVYLSDLSPKDKPWDKHRTEVDGFKTLLRNTLYHRYSIRLADCSCELVFAFAVDENGTCSLKLQAARFCRVRLCPICQWRRSLMWAAKTIQILPKVLEAHPKARFVMLTLTVPNCELSDLRSTLAEMHYAWTKLTKRKEWKIQGWVRSTEVKRRKGDLAGPHYHCLLMVPPSYFGGNYYVPQERWVQLWRECLKSSYDPIVDVRAIHPKRGGTGQRGEDVIDALREVIKYTTKPEDILKGNCQVPGQPVRMTDAEWLVGLISQVAGTRGIATGGVIKHFFNHLEREPEDLVHADENGETEVDEGGPRAAASWREILKRYMMNPD